ncbi:hypothetical protein PPL_05280 [Heterostelium album PN500]|uniref:FZ domain-containing protein n=1 Tax=Heterostelium pallidum (strain ATCC 26659 / Pp 5 / PN500) TaxID=670386 RepID=D3BB94_HETP5|nr:hypothetical protein PPL_05280 [Heterostelium album PN500]EFA81301.1 hypothetical protein PPL_05280 [Heterostelium album PN500]|eukprot:XP_020433419.1 hypothetical protein PPL_05280 [Heterostelium album PN500]
MNISFLLIISLVAGVALSQKAYPEIPQQFTSDVSISTSMMPFPTSGQMYYDFNNLKQRIDATFFGQTSTTLDRHDLGLTFNINPSAQQCECKPLTEPMSPMTVYPGSVFNGVSTDENGNQVDGWTIVATAQVNITIYTLDIDPNTLAEAVMTTFNPDTQTTMTFSNFNPGNVDPAIFAVPSYCSCPTPAPPVPVPTTSCPNNPPRGCSCAPSLKFCDQVNYPVMGEGIDFQGVDQMVETMFEAFTMTTNPPTTCAENTKAFLCATMFSACTSNLIPVLPCADLCPNCSCGGDQQSCAAANVANQTLGGCTNYGSVNFC